MKKKALFSLIIVIITSCLYGCAPKEQFEYSGNDADLYTEAIHSILGTDGLIKGRNGAQDPVLNVIEQDAHGRKMYVYSEKGSMGRVQKYILISQRTSNGFVYYYPDYNFIIGEFLMQDETASEDKINDEQIYWKQFFTESQVTKLKLLNDWNQEIKMEKCIKQKVIQKKDDPLTSSEKNALYNELFNESRNDREVFIDYLTMDDEGKLLYLASNADSSLMDYRMVIIDGDSHYNQKIDDVMAYQEQLAAFKREHNWKKS